MYLGARPDKALYTKTAILKSILNFTESQCKHARIGDILSLFFVQVSSILDNLKTRNSHLRQATIKGVTVIQAWCFERMDYGLQIFVGQRLFIQNNRNCGTFFWGLLN